jgi:hypothetical protein
MSPKQKAGWKLEVIFLRFTRVIIGGFCGTLIAHVITITVPTVSCHILKLSLPLPLAHMLCVEG